MNAQFDTSEVVLLIVMLLTLPALLRYSRALRHGAHRRYFAAVVAFLLVGYVATIVEEFVLGDVLNAVQHLAYGAAGLSAFLGALALRRDVQAERG